MKKFLNFIIIIIIMFCFINVVSAKKEVANCDYSYYSDKSDIGYRVQDFTINIKIYDDGSHKGTSTGDTFFYTEGLDLGGDEELMNWGKKSNGFKDIKGTSCPNYVIVAADLNLFGLFGYSVEWFGINYYDEKDNGEFEEIVGIYKLDSYDPNLDSDDIWAQDIVICEYDYYTLNLDYRVKEISVVSKSAYVNYKASEDLNDYIFNERESRDCTGISSCWNDGILRDYDDPFILYRDNYAGTNEGYTCERDCIMGDTECKNDECPSLLPIKQDIERELSKKNIGAANNLISRVKEVCGTLLSYSQYDDICVTECIEIQEYISLKKRENGIKDSNIGKCGFSDRLFNFIGNIAKWVKYIIPVIVIVLGILDFIKAIASDKDDEMKKAQGRFVKRLIAAALIFIIPFIIELILDKMGFIYNGCGIFE